MNSKLRNILLVIIVLLVIVGLVAPLILSVVAQDRDQGSGKACSTAFRRNLGCEYSA